MKLWTDQGSEEIISALDEINEFCYATAKEKSTFTYWLDIPQMNNNLLTLKSGFMTSL